MAIVPLDKMTIYGAESEKGLVIDQLQELGCVHLEDFGSEATDAEVHDTSSESREALRYLRDCPEQRRQVRRMDHFNRDHIVAEARKLQRNEQALSDESDELRQAIDDLRPWGEFQLPADESIGGVRFRFHVIPLHEMRGLNDVHPLWREVSRDHEHAYVVVFGREEVAEIPGKSVQLDPRPLSTLRARREDVEEQLEEVQHQRSGLTRWCSLLKSTLDEADDATARQKAAMQTFNGSKLYALRGWVPRHENERIREFASENGLAVSIETPSSDDNPPTLLHNPEGLSGTEALVTFYKTPAYRSWDPSIFAYISFALFFAMILADAGYGMVLAIITVLLWKKMGKTGGGRRARNVLSIVVVLTIVYGIACGSYFGIAPSADSFLGRLVVLDSQSQSIMMPLTILVGVIHLSIANVVAAWLHRGQTTALASLGWVAVMAGATLAGMAAFVDVGEQNANLASQVGTILLVSGLAAVLVFSSERPLYSMSIKNHLLRFVDGLKGLTGVSGLFGDVLSYLRLFALGLSSAKLSQTFNDLGASAWDEAGFGVIAAIGIVILGHTLNLLLSIMSGVVHGLRLNCIEFFKYSLPEEGHLFNTFEKKAK